MARHDVTTRSKNGQWVNEIEDAPELSMSFRSREEAEQAGREFAAANGTRHVVEDSEPTGAITDGGDPDDPTPTAEAGGAPRNQSGPGD
ncbi:DUF2188 domain-containing protein [Leucobacter sp. CSA1]|uniref:DUF2188 domain-containing protein n=1 Tax=Leucobacter chromiisoli TaxID=2796471 RepID=A0A934Q8W6_9MICO|nr:DUF2188 domain-containing protein [Leucobacter chromiisoli]MBK0419638.1 DUF2188 domain-containing protein [Leucobacter chromiisoli]